MRMPTAQILVARDIALVDKPITVGQPGVRDLQALARTSERRSVSEIVSRGEG
ncbi:hypothetical protein J5Y09_15935 [Roseomonas sp. PWR1]|uniref:Uncharacterized protein n=1 Tax=Roseomonas nitratireducens TaxID=2820810 RepID=A0ABS4AXY7_9PROT|nr:hypothetical protein [Neoroseomonas nitratireducens]MBP0465417.1 hypothetical protein [Neoroseomonas nitratireducens]